MILTYISIVVGTLTFGLFMISFQLNGINRAIVNIPVSLIESCIDYEDITLIPFINKDLAIRRLSDYISDSIERYTNDYDIDFYFYNVEDSSYCVSNLCSGINVEVSSTLMYNYHFHRVMYYEVLKS